MKIFYLICFLFFSISLSAQNNQEKEQYIGFLVGSMIPINNFGVSSIELSENNSNITLNNKIGYNFGMVFKSIFTKSFSLESGIVFYQRNFRLTGSSSNLSGVLRDTSFFSYISYGIPTQGIVYIQLGNELFLRNSIGFNIDFYASSVASKGIYFGIDHLSERARWINGSITGNLGFEKRSDQLGTFYFGAEVNIPISAIAVTKLKYNYGGNNPDRYENLFLRGNYFGIQFKYYLPKNLEKIP